MGATPPVDLRPSDWVTRCAEQVRLADPDLSEQEALDVALQLFSFERTMAMSPEKAVGFVMAQLAGPAPRFERRSPSRLKTIRVKS